MMAEDWKRDCIGATERGEHPLVLARMRSGFAVIGDTQFLPGYCVLLAAPSVGSLNDLSLPHRAAFLTDMTLIGDALLAACDPTPIRINYDVLGNTDAYLHAHIFPRYADEPEERRRHPIWLYPGESWSDSRYQYNDATHGALRERITVALQERMRHAYGEQGSNDTGN